MGLPYFMVLSEGWIHNGFFQFFQVIGIRARQCTVKIFGSIHQDLPDDQELPKIDITATKACSSKQKNLLIDNEAYAKEILKPDKVIIH